MTPSEFKAWFDGFTEAFGTKMPTKAQWTRIKERVGEIDGTPITEKVFIDRWYPYISRWVTYSTPTIYCSNAATSTGIYYNSTSAIPLTFDSTVAMNAAGRAEAASLGG